MRLGKLFVCALLVGCGGVEEVPEPQAVPRAELLPDADAGSAVRIESLERLCAKVDGHRAHEMTAIAFTGQRLRWKGHVESFAGQRLVVTVGSLHVDLRFESFQELSFEVGEVVEVAGVIESVQARERRVVLRPEATAAAPGH